jgi:tRNA C32,U32 (ribose-2'-O)-methylase TrmJ
LERLFTRAQLDKTELNIFRGILSRIEYITSNREK